VAIRQTNYDKNDLISSCRNSRHVSS